MQELAAVKVEGGAIVGDARARPIVFVTWFGTATPELVDLYFDWHTALVDDLIKKREKIVLVTDTFVLKRPDATVRKRILERNEVLLPRAEPQTVASIIVVDNALVRGALTALSWVDPKLRESELVDTPDKAIERGLSILDEEGIARPVGFSARGYARPADPNTA